MGQNEIGVPFPVSIFDVKHTFATVRGQFADFSWTSMIDPENKVASRCDIEMEVNSVNIS